MFSDFQQKLNLYHKLLSFSEIFSTPMNNQLYIFTCIFKAMGTFLLLVIKLSAYV